MKLIIGNKNYSSWSLRAWLLPSVNDIPFDEIRISLSRDSSEAEIARYSDAGRVPVLHDNGLVVWDSLAICEYISEKYLAGRGWPADQKERAQARSYCAEMHSGFLTLRQALPMNCRAAGRKVVVTEDLQEEISRIDNIWSSLRAGYQDRGPWLFGDFSIADCMFAPVVFRFHTYGVSVSERSREYMAGVLANPKVQLWLNQAKGEVEVIEDEETGF